MNRARWLIPILIVVSCAGVALGGDEEPLFRVHRLSERVIVFTEVSPWESNHVVIVGRDGLVLVDPGHTPLMGRLLRQAIASELGQDRIAWVIDTHEHWGHTWGNAAFPEALVIAHDRAVAAMVADLANRERRVEVIRTQAEQTESTRADLDPDSEEGQAARLRFDHLDRIVRGLSEPGFTLGIPRVTFSDHLRLALGDLNLDMHYLGRGHSESDIVILVPEEKILLLGCFFLEQGPLPVFGVQPALDPQRWLEVFDMALASEPQVEQVILGQHTIWPRARFKAMRDYIAGLWSALQELDEEGVDLETAIARYPVPEELGFLRQTGVSDDDLARYHRGEIVALWRQLKESAAAAIERAIADGGAEAGVALYRDLVARDDHDFFFDENELNLLGYRLLGNARVDEAIAVFQINVERFPDSWNVYDSLGEAFAVKGDHGRAIELYRRSLELNPANTNGVQALERLGAGSPPG